MSAAPTNESVPGTEPAEDPWQVPASRATGTKTTAARAEMPAKAAQRRLTPQQAARFKRRQQAQARLAARMTWPFVLRLMVLSVACRLLMAAVLIAYSVEDRHLHSVLVSRTTTFAQWEAAVHTSHSLAILVLPFAFGLAAPGPIWSQVRVYVAKLPGAAPHPLRRTNLQYRLLNVPAFWPPVPEGAASWTRRIHWRVPPAVTASFAILLGVTNVVNRWILTAPSSRTELSSVVDLVAAALALVVAAFDLVRLREYKRWPGRP